MPSEADDLEAFESHQPALRALAYRMLGDLSRAEDVVQEAWVRWRGRRDPEVDSPKAYLLSVVTRLCLTELDSARARFEESRSDRLPEPVDLRDDVLRRLEHLDHLSMAFLVMLQRLTPIERAVFVLREVFDFDYERIARVIGKNEIACRQILSRARRHVSMEGRACDAEPEIQKRLLHAFIEAATAGNVDRLASLLAEDAVMVTDGGPSGLTSSGIRSLPRPLVGGTRIAAVVGAAGPRTFADVQVRDSVLNGQPAALAFRDGVLLSAMVISIDDGKITQVFVQADPARLDGIRRSAGAA